jgi:hypothetical protein
MQLTLNYNGAAEGVDEGHLYFGWKRQLKKNGADLRGL